MPSRKGIEPPMSRRDATAPSVGDGVQEAAVVPDEPLRIAVAPTIRLSDEIPRSTIVPADRVGASSRRVEGFLLVRPKPRSRRERLWRLFRRTHRISFFFPRRPGATYQIIYRRSNFSRRMRGRGLTLMLFNGMGALLSFFSAFGLLICVLGLAVSWAELKVGWARLSRTATSLVWGSIGLAVVGLLAQAIPWIAQLQL